MSNYSLILDFETLDTAPTAAITEIGCIAVHRESLEVENHLSFYPHILPQLASGRTFSSDTITWMEKKNLIPGDQLSTRTLKSAMEALHSLIQDYKPYRIWAWGKDFERPLFEHASIHCGIPIQEHQFRLFSCARDQWQNAFGMEARPPERTHHALQDTIDELRDLTEALRKTNLIHVF